MKKYFLSAVLFFILIAVSSSASAASLHPVQDSSKYATVIIYRIHLPKASKFSSFYVQIADTAFKVKDRTAHEIRISKEGELIVSTKNETYDEKKLDIRFGETYYISCVNHTGQIAARPELVISSKFRGESDVKMILKKD